MSGSLVFLNGPDPGSEVRLETTRGDYTAGRDPECQLHVDDRQASRMHARIWHEGDSWRIEDCESRNGTMVNSRVIQRSVLHLGDLIRIGERMMVFCREQPSPGTNDVMPAHLTDNTRVRRILGAEKRRMADDPLATDSTTGSMRKLAHLYRLSKELYRADDLPSLVERTIEGVKQGVGADVAKVCVRGVDGRLQTHANALPGNPQQHSAHFLSNWVVERDEALLIDVNENLARQGEDDSVEQGTAIGVPVPGRSRPRGAIECFHADRGKRFDLADLEFMIAVAQQFGMALENLEHRERIEQSNRQLRNKLKQNTTRLLGESPAIRQLLEQISRVAPTGSTVLTLGESGSGKEVVAQTIHQLGSRSEGPFLTVNCAAFSESLLESELFGHEKGAFTGADSRRQGQFERAHRGTIFLDEVGEMSAACQAKLLRLLEGHPFERLGGNSPVKVDVRIVAATNRDLREMVRKGRFREDLWYRLRVIELNIPPLRSRGDDIIRLATHFLDRFRSEMGHGPSRFAPETTEAMLCYSWPGNVRELKNAVERAMVLGASDEIAPDDLGLASTTGSARRETELLTLADAERRHIERVLESADGNKTKACKILDIGRATLYNKLNRIES